MRKIITAIVVLMLIVGTLSATAGILLSHAAFKLIKSDAQRPQSHGFLINNLRDEDARARA